MIRPIVALERPWRSERARSLRWNPSATMASPTRAAVPVATPASSLMTRETVFRLTPARCATSRMVGLVALTATFLLAPPEIATTLADNVVGGTLRGPGVRCQGPRTFRAALPPADTLSARRLARRHRQRRLGGKVGTVARGLCTSAAPAARPSTTKAA